MDFFFLGISTLALENGRTPFLHRISSRDKVGLVPGVVEVGDIAYWEVGLAGWAMGGFKGELLSEFSEEEIC